MKIGFAHCRLMDGWAENVLKDSIKNHHAKEIKIFTLVSDKPYLTVNNKTIQVSTVIPKIINNFLLWITQKNIPIISMLFDYRNLIVLTPLRAWIMSKQIQKYSPDHIYISSFARAKNINTYWTKTTLYLHSPMQYIRTHYDEYTQKLKSWRWRLFKQITPPLRKRDKQHRKYDNVITNSIYTQKIAKELYNLDSIIEYPAIEQMTLQYTPSTEIHDYFVYTGRLVTFVKELDKIITACNQTKTNLIIIGDGPDKEKLQTLAGDTIMFIPWIKDIQQRSKIIQQAKWSINITKESFGISTMESLLLGVPVLWYNQWATTELVDAKSGILIPDKKIATIVNAIKQREKKDFDRKYIHNTAKKTYKKHKK